MIIDKRSGESSVALHAKMVYNYLCEWGDGAMARRCSECPYCKCVDPLNTRYLATRKWKYYCVHPDLTKLPRSVFHSEYALVGFGRDTTKTDLTIRTHPRWCPLEIFR